MKSKQRNQRRAKVVLAGGSVLAAGIVLTDLQKVLQPSAPGNVCQEIVQSQSVLSRDELSRLLNVPERSNQSTIRAIVSEPYCKLPPIEVRAGATAEREVYPLAFDPNTWLVVLYEGNEYAGYDFVFQK
jgi:hypothetical protein